MICEHCEYSVHGANEYTGDEFLYCTFYNDKCPNLIPDKCMFTQKRSSCKYFNMNDGTCPKKCALCMFVNPEKHCSDYARKDALATESMYQSYRSFMTKCLNKPYKRKEEETAKEGLSIWDMYPSITKILNEPCERRKEEMGEKCNNRVYFKFNDDYVPFDSIGEVTYVGGLVKSNYISCAPRQITPRKVIFSGPKTIVIWEDGTKTIVGCAKDQEYDEYAGFCAALAKKIFGTTAKAKRMMNKNKKVDISKDLEEVDYEALKYQIQNALSNVIKECLNMCSSMEFEEKLDDIHSEKEKDDEQS